MANMHLVTGFAGYEHVTSADQGLFNSYIFGDLEVVMERGNQFAASIISNNIIRVKDGDLLMQGRFARLNDDSYVDLTIDNGTQGYFRNDLIVARYQKDIVTAVETVDLVVIKGENAESDPADPAHVKGDIKFGKDFQNDIPLWRVSLDGLNVTGLTCLFSTFGSTLSALIAHADTHKTGGSDPITPAGIGAADANTVQSHIDNQTNPHNVTAEQVMVTENVVNAIKETGNWSVDGVLAQLGSALFSGDALYRWTKTRIDLVLRYANSTATCVGADPDIHWSKTVEIGADNKISLVNPTIIKVPAGYPSSLTIPEGYFYIGDSSEWGDRSTVYWSDGTTVASRELNGADRYKITFYRISNYQVGTISELVTSTDQNAHYDGEVDVEGCTYTALDPITTFVPRMQTGSYVGTGTYGTYQYNSLTFEFVPKLVMVARNDMASHLNANTIPMFLWFGQDGVVAANAMAFSRHDTTLDWSATSSAEHQFNSQGVTYRWVAIG